MLIDVNILLAIGAILLIALVAWVLMSKNDHHMFKQGAVKSYMLKLDRKKQVSDNTYSFRFLLPNANASHGLLPCQHLSLSAETPDGRLMCRTYTPVSTDADRGFIDFIIKVYEPTPEFPKGGKMSQYIHQLDIGDKIKVSGPKGKVCYIGNGLLRFVHSKKTASFQHVGMICGGSGLTPMLQMIYAVMHERQHMPRDLHLLCSNKMEYDIVLREELDRLEKDDDNFHVFHTITRGKWQNKSLSKSNNHFNGRVCGDMIKKTMPKPSKDTLMLLCGPLSMTKCMKELLIEMSYPESMILVL